MALDLSVYLVIGTRDVGRGEIGATVRAAVAGGVSAVQLRDKHASARELTVLAAHDTGWLANMARPQKRPRISIR